jgi:hypothetical protein
MICPYTIQPKTEKARKTKCEHGGFLFYKKEEKNVSDGLQFVVNHVC